MSVSWAKLKKEAWQGMDSLRAGGVLILFKMSVWVWFLNPKLNAAFHGEWKGSELGHRCPSFLLVHNGDIDINSSKRAFSILVQT